MRKYRLRLYDGAYELLSDETHAIVVDLDSPAGFATAQATLGERASALIRRAQAVGEHVSAPRLEVCDWLTGTKELDWPC